MFSKQIKLTLEKYKPKLIQSKKKKEKKDLFDSIWYFLIILASFKRGNASYEEGKELFSLKLCIKMKTDMTHFNIRIK